MSDLLVGRKSFPQRESHRIPSLVGHKFTPRDRRGKGDFSDSDVRPQGATFGATKMLYKKEFSPPGIRYNPSKACWSHVYIWGETRDKSIENSRLRFFPSCSWWEFFAPKIHSDFVVVGACFHLRWVFFPEIPWRKWDPWQLAASPGLEKSHR